MIPRGVRGLSARRKPGITQTRKAIPVGFLHFYYTIAILLISIMASALCLSGYAVSRRKTFLFAFTGFFFYFLDVALVFQDDFATISMGIVPDSAYLSARSVATIVSGGGVFFSVWAMIYSFFGEKNRALLFAPGVAFVAGSLAVLLFMDEDPTSRFLFYAMRALLLFWSLGFALVRFLGTQGDIDRKRMLRFKWLYLAMWAFGIAFFAEDAYCFLVVGGNVFGAVSDVSLNAERNYAEELLMIVCAALACRDALRTLKLRYDHPPTREDENVESAIMSNLEMYASRFKLSKREQEVLRLILLGYDNQNIASSMHVALSTTKVHVHNILQKTGQANRQDLVQNFWKTW